MRLPARITTDIYIMAMPKRRTLDWYTSPICALDNVAALQPLRPLQRQSHRLANSCAI